MTVRLRPLTISRLRVSQMWLAVVGTLLTASCGHEPAVQTIDVSLSPGQSYEYPTVGGDEEGARVVTQAGHFAISEIRRNAETNWIATYVYEPKADYSGPDGSEIEVLTGSDGASPPRQVTRVVFRFSIEN